MKDKVLNYLIVCHANINRSKTAEDVCRQIAEQNNLEINVNSAGISKFSTKAVTKEMADKADVIFVMEEYMKRELERDFNQAPGKIVCLNIPDIYERGDLMLVRILRSQLSPYLRKNGHPNEDR